MFAIIDKNTNKITQTININCGIKLSENELIQEISNELYNKFISAYEYDMTYDGNKISDINILKSWIQCQQEQPLPTIETTQENYLLDLDFRISKIELGE